MINPNHPHPPQTMRAVHPVESAVIVNGLYRMHKIFVSIHGVVELVEIPNNKSQITNKYQ
jgi:hypothetical protein